MTGGGGGLGEHDRLREGGGVGGAQVGGLRMVGRPGVRGRGGRGVVTRRARGQLRHWVVDGRLLLLDVGGGGGPPAGPHPGVGRVGLVLSPRPLQVLLQVAVDVSVV